MTEAKLPEKEEDLQTRIDGFNKELPLLLGKYELGLTAQSRISNGLIIADPVVVSARNMPKPEIKPTNSLSKPEEGHA